jgi:pyochelin synthetase
LEQQFGSRPRIDQLFRLRTVAALVAHYEQNGKASSAPQGVAAQIASFRVLLDPAERDAFKASEPGVRRGDDERPSIRLLAPEATPEGRDQFARRRSHRQFALKPIPFAQFSGFLSCLRRLELAGKPKYLYASPGGLYPGQVYVHVKPGRVDDVPSGAYYYHPVDHRLVVLTPNVNLDREIHIPFINTPIFDEAAFSIFLVTQLKAIAPAYGDRSIHFATLEAGIVANLLETHAPSHGIGLCQIGSVEFDRVRPIFALDETHLLIHSLLGGAIAEAGDHAEPLTTSGQQRDDARARRLLQEVERLSPGEVRKLLDAHDPGARRPVPS